MYLHFFQIIVKWNECYILITVYLNINFKVIRTNSSQLWISQTPMKHF